MPATSHFQIWDGSLESSIPFPELEPTDGSSVKWRNRIVDEPMIGSMEGTEIGSWFDATGGCVLSIIDYQSQFLLHVPRRARFLLPKTPDGDILFARDGEVSYASLRHQIINVVLPLQLSRRGKIILHGSAVSVAGKAVAFVGRGGSGKSTLAALLIQGPGGTLIADDAVLIEANAKRATVIPSYNGLRITQDSRNLLSLGASPGVFDDYGHKDYLKTDRFSKQPVELHAIYFVSAQNTGTPSIRRLTASEAFAGIAGHSFILDPTNANLLTAQFQLVSRLNRLAQSFRFDYTHTAVSASRSIEMLAAHSRLF